MRISCIWYFIYMYETLNNEIIIRVYVAITYVTIYYIKI